MNIRLFGLLAGVLVVLGAPAPLWGQDGFGGTTQTVGTQQYSPDQGCAPSTTALCLQSGRFKVELEWDAPGEKGGPAVVLPRTDDSGLFFFFNETNMEVRVKVVDGCNTNGSFWVFYGSLTNVGFELTVTDTATDLVKVYTSTNPSFASVGDCDAFRVGDCDAFR